MERSDFVDRKGDRTVDFMQYNGLVERVFSKEHNIPIATFRLLLYLAPIPYFTRQDFMDGTLYYVWDNRRFSNLLKDGWITAVNTTHKRAGVHYRYNVSVKGMQLVNLLYDILCGKVDLPTKYKRNGGRKDAGYIDRAEKKAIEAMENRRAKERFAE